MSNAEPLQPISASQMEDLEKASLSYAGGMTVEAARYLLARGLSEETVRTARVGVVTEPELPQHNRYTGRISIPYIVEGKVVQIRFRCIDSHGGAKCRELNHGKYEQPAGTRLRTYGVDVMAEAEDTIHITEGEFDSLVLNQLGLPAIAFPGVESFRSHHGRMLAGFNRIWVWGDPDEAGADFIQKVINRLPRSARGVKLRGGDVTETYLAGGPKAIYALVEE